LSRAPTVNFSEASNPFYSAGLPMSLDEAKYYFVILAHVSPFLTSWTFRRADFILAALRLEKITQNAQIVKAAGHGLSGYSWKNSNSDRALPSSL